MPLYEYRCERCEEKFEELRSLSNTEPVLCPSCGAPAEKLFSSFSMGGGGRGAACSAGSAPGGSGGG